MPTRNESAVYFEQTLDLTRTLPFIAAWNARHEQKLTLFDLIIAGVGKALIERPGLWGVGGQSKISFIPGYFFSLPPRPSILDCKPTLKLLSLFL